jgi:uncharacterized protein YecE (DUF72 family)
MSSSGENVRKVRVGCSGWSYDHWREAFYPGGCAPGRWLRFYATHFDTVEVNATFYRLPTREAVARWAEESPPGFLFTVKASRYLTHVKRLREIEPGIALLWERLEPLRASRKLGPLLWQLPPTFRRDEERLAAALSAFPPKQRHAIEFRHESWFTPEVYGLLRERNAALAIGDHPRVNAFQSHELTADFTVVRFHGGTRGRRGNYSRRELDEWAARLRSWSSGVDVYAYFNNDWEAFAVRNARYLQGRLDAGPAPRPHSRAEARA